jgi:hypothetical protein
MRPGTYRALIASPSTLTGMARWVSGELRRIEQAAVIGGASAPGVPWDFDDGGPATVYGVGTIDLENGGP